MKKLWTIYCHQHIESGRRYIGLTSKTMLARWNDHIYKSKSSKNGRWHFPNAIRKYGSDAFSHQILEVCTDLEVANLAEECWIEFLDTRNLEKGFNLAKGGQHIPHPIRKNPWDNPEYREKQLARLMSYSSRARANNKAALNTPESKIKRSISSKIALSQPGVIEKRVSSFKATVNTPESRAKRSAASKKALSTPESKARKSAASKALWEDSEFRLNNLTRVLIMGQTPEARAAQKASLNTRESREKRSITSKEASNTPESRAKRSAASKAFWENPEFINKMMLSLRNRTKENYPAVQNYHERRSKIADERSVNMTHIFCIDHGHVSVNECYHQIVKGRSYYSCRICKNRRLRVTRQRKKLDNIP